LFGLDYLVWLSWFCFFGFDYLVWLFSLAYLVWLIWFGLFSLSLFGMAYFVWFYFVWLYLVCHIWFGLIHFMNSLCSQSRPVQPGWQEQTPAAPQSPWPLQAASQHSLTGSSHSAPFQPAWQWQDPPP
jgi:hypothetical protein